MSYEPVMSVYARSHDTRRFIQVRSDGASRSANLFSLSFHDDNAKATHNRKLAQQKQRRNNDGNNFLKSSLN